MLVLFRRSKRLVATTALMLTLLVAALSLADSAHTTFGGEVPSASGLAAIDDAAPAASIADSARPSGSPDVSSSFALTAPTATTLGSILVDNHIDIRSVVMGDTFDDAQSFTTGPDDYLLTGVELTMSVHRGGTALSLSINEPTEEGGPGATLYQLRQPTLVEGKNFFAAPAHAILLPNTEYLLRIDVTASSAIIHFTDSIEETDAGLQGWSIADYFLTSSGNVQGIEWTKVHNEAYAITVRGSLLPDRHGSQSYTAGKLAFSRYTGTSPTERESINSAGDTDWYNTSLAFDYGGRYRIDVQPESLTNDDDIGVRAFYVDYPDDHSLDKVVEVTSVADPPEGYVSWHFQAGRNYGPYIEVYADNDTTGVYGIRVVYDPDRVWTGTEVVRGDLPHDDTSWATVVVDAEESDEGIYHYYEDHDWFEVELESDTGYMLQAIASDRYSSYIDPALRLFDDSGTQLAVDYVGEDENFAVITHQVGTDEGGTYYLDVSNTYFQDDATRLARLGMTQGFEVYSPYIGTRYYVLASEIENNMRRSLRSVQPANAPPRIHNRRVVALEENRVLGEYITASDIDAEDAITGFEISGGDDQDFFSVRSSGVLTMRPTPDYEVPADANMDNSYEVQVQVTSGSGERERSVTADFTIKVTDDDTEADSVLVSNTGKTVKGNAKVENSDSALRIYTGPNSDGYVIHSVAFGIAEALEDPSGIKVSLWSNHKPGKYARPKKEIFAFTNPSSINARLTEFTAPPDTVLEPDTSYWLMVERTGDTPIKLLDTASDSLDSISVPGWYIGGLRFYRPRNINGQWGYSKVKSNSDQFMLRVIGYERSIE